MAWPPAALPINMTNLTQQNDVHPNLHNATAQAVNDTVAQLANMENYLRPTGATYRQTGQVIPATTVGTMGWNFRSTDRYGAGDQLVIPAGDEGLWILTVAVQGPAAFAGSSHDVVIDWNGLSYATGILPGKGIAAVTASGRCGPGAMAQVRVYNSDPTAQYFSADFAINRAAY